MEQHSLIRRLSERFGTRNSRSSSSSGSTNGPGCTHRTCYPNRQSTTATLSTVRDEAEDPGRSHYCTQFKMADFASITTRRPTSPSCSSTRRSHATRKSSIDAGGTSEAAAGGQVLLLRRGCSSCQLVSRQEVAGSESNPGFKACTPHTHKD